MRIRALAAVICCASACAVPACVGDPDGPDVDVVAGALGQPSGDFPDYEERVILYATNRARMSPAAEGWPAYAAQPPLQWHVDLNHSAPAHSQDMHDTAGCFQHPTCGSATDDTFDRVRMYYTATARSLSANIL